MKKASMCPILLFLLIGGLSGSEGSPVSDRPQLEQILAKTGEYCSRLKKMAFDFVCKENIKETTNIFQRKKVLKRTESSSDLMEVTELSLRRARNKTLLYDYQMIKKGDKIEEKRILLEENKRKKNEKDAQLKIQRYWAQYLVFGPAGFLSKSWQDGFRYSLVGEDVIDGKKTIIVQASPSSLRDENYNFGKIWVDAENSSILKIEWDQKSIQNFKEEVDSSIGDLKRTVTWAVFYGMVKNGIRFPSRQIITEHLISHTGQKHIKYKVTIDYEDYKFFTVETDVKY